MTSNVFVPMKHSPSGNGLNMRLHSGMSARYGSKSRIAVISTTSSAQVSRKEGEYIGALLPIAGLSVLTHLVRSLVDVGFNHLVVVHANNSQDVAEEMERFRQELMQSVVLSVVNAHTALDLPTLTEKVSYCHGVLAAREYVGVDDAFMLVSSDHIYTRSLIRRMYCRLDGMYDNGTSRSKKSHAHDADFHTPKSIVLCDASAKVFANAGLLSLRLTFDENTGTISKARRFRIDAGASDYQQQSSHHDITPVAGNEFNALDTGVFIFSADFWLVATLLHEPGYFSIADVLTHFINNASPEDAAVIGVLTHNAAWFTCENQPEGARLVQMVEDGGWLSGRYDNEDSDIGMSIPPSDVGIVGGADSDDDDDPVVEFLERKSKLARFESSLEGIPLPVSFFYTSDIRGLLWHHLQSLSRRAIDDIKKDGSAFQPDHTGRSDVDSNPVDIESECSAHGRVVKKKPAHPATNTIVKVRIVWRLLRAVQAYFAFPTRQTLAHMENLLDQGRWKIDRFYSICIIVMASIEKSEIGPSLSDVLHKLDSEMVPNLSSAQLSDAGGHHLKLMEDERHHNRQYYFEVLVVGKMSEHEREHIARHLLDKCQSSDEFAYSFAFAESFEDAVTGVLFNRCLQTIIITETFAVESQNALSDIQCFLSHRERAHYKKQLGRAMNSGLEQMRLLTAKIKSLLPSMDIFWLTTEYTISQPHEVFATYTSANGGSALDWMPIRVFHDIESDATELHFSIMHAISEKFRTPFFHALQDYALKPTGVFHALPVSRGNSIFHSLWLRDFEQFYGPKLFLAETSATTGGLDSLLEPRGVIREAQVRAAKAFGADCTFFVTNGTSTANKIVLQALLSPGDIIFVDRNCHKSHHYGAVLQGASVCYLDAYKLQEYGIYGTVPCERIISTLLWYKQRNLLDKVKVLLLTNCTFDGLVYNVRRVMERCLAIKPDLVFLWDEAWFAFARFTPTYRRRTGMHVAGMLKAKYRSDEYRREYLEYRRLCGPDATPTIPDPDKVRIRVYSTQSTHKTLSSLRQGSMIHVHDEDFRVKVEQAFHEAYMTHTSTSPNYQILASLDCARRQVEMEGFNMVQKSVEKAMMLRMSSQEHPLVRKYFKFLDSEEMIPASMREKGKTPLTCLSQHGFTGLDESWCTDEVTLDPTRLTLLIRATGFNGDTFKKILMDEHGIQVNKTSINTVLFMTNIGTTSSAVSHLSNSLLKIAHTLETQSLQANVFERAVHFKQIQKCLPPLPDFSYWHPKFIKESEPTYTSATSSENGEEILKPRTEVNESEMHMMPGCVRDAYFLGNDTDNIEYLMWNEINEARRNRSIVGATFIIPYPPGFPVVVPGQVITSQIIDFMCALDVSEVHGYIEGYGVRVFKESVLA